MEMRGAACQGMPPTYKEIIVQDLHVRVTYNFAEATISQMTYTVHAVVLIRSTVQLQITHRGV